MTGTARREAQQLLQQAGERIASAEPLLAAENILAVLRQLAQAQRLAEEAKATLLGDCLQGAMVETCYGDRQARERGLDELTRFMDTAGRALCPNCRRRVAARLMDTET
jgi:hypothetical protein